MKEICKAKQVDPIRNTDRQKGFTFSNIWIIRTVQLQILEFKTHMCAYI